MLLMAFFCIFSVALGEISLCSTSVIIDRETYSFHVESMTDMDTAVYSFCKKFNLGKTDCRHVRDNHVERCFPSHMDKVDKPTQKDNIDVTGLSSVATHIDYSEKVGPALPVTFANGNTRTIQAFKGETFEMCVKRFCGMAKLDHLECKQVHNGFMAHTQNDEMTPLHFFEELHSAKPTTVASSKLNDVHGRVESVLRGFYEDASVLLNQYWYYITTVCGLLWALMLLW